MVRRPRPRREMKGRARRSRRAPDHKGTRDPDGHEHCPGGVGAGPLRRIRPPHARRPHRPPSLHAAHARHRGARDEPVPPGQGPRLLLRRLRPGGRVGRRDVRDVRAGPAVRPPPRPRRAPDPRRHARADPRPVHGPRRRRHERRCAITWFGDGSTSRGDFHEAMNWAGVQKLPVVFVLENNQYAYSTPTGAQFAVDPVERAQAYGFPGISVDGNDVEAMFEATRQARERALDGGGPTLIEAVTMRMHGHAAHDDMKYVPKEQVEEWRKKDPIDRQEARLRELGVDVDEV